MKVKLNEPIRNFNNEIMKMDRDGKIDSTLGRAIVEALMFLFEDEKIDGNEKMKRYTLATRIFDKDEAELSAEDIALIKNLVGKVFPAIVVGRVYDMLEAR